MLHWLEQKAGSIYADNQLGAFTAYRFFGILTATYSGIAFAAWLLSSGQLMVLITEFFIAGATANVLAICARRRWRFHKAMNRLAPSHHLGG